VEIVYCGGCGKVLREDDFRRGQARFLDNRPWCAECRPPDKTPIPAARKTGSSAKHPRVIAAPPTPPPRGDDSKKRVILGVAIALVGALGLLAFMNSGSPPPTKRGSEPQPQVAAPREDVERLLRDLESFASLAAPNKILARCDELRSKFRGAPEEKRFQAIEAAARDRERDVQFGRDLEAIQRIIDEDARFERFDQVVRRFKGAKALAGPRSGEVDRRLAEYEASGRIREKHLGPFGTDDQGFIRNWLVLGLFPNEKDQGIDLDYLNGEAAHDPVAGLTVGRAKWTAFESAESKIDIFKIPHLRGPSKDNVVLYASCLVQTVVTVAAEFRLGSDDGGALWVDGRQIGKVHRSRALKVDEDRYAVPLAPGVHRILVKVDNHNKGFEFILRVVGADGTRLPSLRVWN
jgi:hypothetical protein